MRVLLVEDDPSIARLTTYYLEKLNAEVERFCKTLLGRPRPAILGLKEYLHSAPRMDEQGALDYARSLHSMVNTAAAMKKGH